MISWEDKLEEVSWVAYCVLMTCYINELWSERQTAQKYKAGHELQIVIKLLWTHSLIIFCMYGLWLDDIKSNSLIFMHMSVNCDASYIIVVDLYRLLGYLETSAVDGWYNANIMGFFLIKYNILTNETQICWALIVFLCVTMAFNRESWSQLISRGGFVCLLFVFLFSCFGLSEPTYLNCCGWKRLCYTKFFNAVLFMGAILPPFSPFHN